MVIINSQLRSTALISHLGIDLLMCRLCCPLPMGSAPDVVQIFTLGAHSHVTAWPMWGPGTQVETPRWHIRSGIVACTIIHLSRWHKSTDLATFFWGPDSESEILRWTMLFNKPWSYENVFDLNLFWTKAERHWVDGRGNQISLTTSSLGGSSRGGSFKHCLFSPFPHYLGMIGY